MRLFLTHRKQWAALRADRSLLPQAVEETLRLCPAPNTHTRTALQSVTFEAADARNPQPPLHLNAGDQVIVSVFAANRDGAVFGPNSHEFDITRPLERSLEHLSFGCGTHVCLGDALARYTSVAHCTLLHRLCSLTSLFWFDL